MTVRCKFSAGILILSAGAMLASVADAQSAPTTARTAPCALPGLASPARCGTLDLPENPADPNGRKLPIHFAIVPALSGKALSDPIAMLMGGPGEDAISNAADAAAQFAALRTDRDILLVDQRGTGLSAALQCDLYAPDDPAASLIDLFPRAAVEACEKRLQGQADLTRYTYAYFATDLEQVRQALGYGSLNLFAGSYGTRAAQTFMRAYPHSVRTAYLGSVVPVDLPSPLMFARTAQTGLDHMIQDCEADAACHTAFPDVRGDAAAIFARLDGDRVRVSLPGRAEPATLGRGRVAEWVRSRLYRPAGAATLPKLFHQAVSGDWTPIADGVLTQAREADKGLSFGLLFAITCSEDIPYVNAQDIPAESDGTFLGAYRLKQQQAACAGWPASSLPAGYRQALRTDIPTLFVTGDHDGDTPLWFTDHVAAGFSHRALVVVHGQGHTEWNDCLSRLYEQFVRTGAADALDTACPAIPLPPFAR